MSKFEGPPRQQPEFEPPEAYYIGEFSDESERLRAQRTTPTDELFGSSGLKMNLEIAANQKGSALSPEEENKIYGEAMDMPKKLLVRWIEMNEKHALNPDESGKPAEAFVQEACEIDGLRDKLVAVFGKDPREGVTTGEIKEVVEQGKIDDRTFADMIEHHHKVIGERISLARVEVEQMQEELVSDIARLREAGVVTVPEEIIDKRLERTDVVFVDPLEASPRSRGSHGSGGRLSMRLDQDAIERKHVYYHEMTHALLSGRKIRAWKDGYFTQTQEEKFGLLFEKPIDPASGQKSRLGIQKYEGLNEAVTEDLTQLLLDNQETFEDSSYGIARLRLEKITDSGIPKQAFYDAYQESADPTDPDNLPAWQKLQELVNQQEDTKGQFKMLAKKPELS